MIDWIKFNKRQSTYIEEFFKNSIVNPFEMNEEEYNDWLRVITEEAYHKAVEDFEWS